jgi:hypothetical protein
LLQLLVESADAGSEASQESSLDSQLTINDDPCGNRTAACTAPAATEMKEHWSTDPAFNSEVDKRLEACLGEPWFSNSFFYHAPYDFEANAQASATFIREFLEGRCEFKIGITECPMFRWTRTDCGYCLQGGFDTMYLLYAAPTSKWKWMPTDSQLSLVKHAFVSFVF